MGYTLSTIEKAMYTPGLQFLWLMKEVLSSPSAVFRVRSPFQFELLFVLNIGQQFLNLFKPVILLIYQNTFSFPSAHCQIVLGG